MNSNLADYAVPVNADIHSIDVHFIDKPDPHIDPFIGARGVGEITATSALHRQSPMRFTMPLANVCAICLSRRTRYFRWRSEH